MPEHQRQRQRGGDQVGVDAHTKHPQAAGQVMLPELLVPLHVGVAAEDVVDQNVEPTLLAVDPLDQPGHLIRLEMVDPEGPAVAAGSRYQFTSAPQSSPGGPSRTCQQPCCCGRSRIRKPPPAQIPPRSRVHSRAWRPPRARLCHPGWLSCESVKQTTPTFQTRADRRRSPSSGRSSGRCLKAPDRPRDSGWSPSAGSRPAHHTGSRRVRNRR